MKKFLFSLLAIFVMVVSLTGCSKNGPKSVAEKFLEGLYHYDYETAKEVSTDETKKMLDLMAEFSARVPESEKQEAKKIKIDIKDVKEENDTALVTYTLSDDPKEKKVRLVKQKGEWMVHYTKADTYNEVNESEELDDSNPSAEETPADSMRH